MQVSKPVVIGAVVAMVAMVGAIAFLLGRESGRHHAAPVVASELATAAPVAAVTPAPIPTLTGAAPYVVTPPAAPPAPIPAPVAAVAPHRQPPPPLSNELDEAAQVHAYFLHITEIQAGPSGDPGEVSNKLISSLLNGDASGFDSLIDNAKAMLASAQAVPVPAPCAAYHQQLLKLLADSLAMLQQLEPAIKHGDTGAATAILPAATALQNQATALESQGRELKARYGI